MNKKVERGRPTLSAEALNERRTEISAIALRLFLEEGFEAVSMRRLAQELGLSPMALYRYFPTKLDILSSLWEHIIGLAFSEVINSLEGEKTPEARLLKASQAYVGYWLQHVDHYHLVFMCSGVTKEMVQSFIAEEGVLENYNIFFTNIAEMHKEQIAGQAVKQSADGLVAHLHGIMHSVITMRGYPWTDHHTLVNNAVASAINAIDAAQ
jgi:AcrR family transcriptional regulator